MRARRESLRRAIERWRKALARRTWSRHAHEVGCVAVALATAAPAAADAPGSELFLRGIGTASLSTRPVNYTLDLERSGAALSAPIDTTDRRAVFGAQADLGYLFLIHSGLAGGPRLSYSFAAPLEPNERVLQTDVDRYVMREDPSLHMVTTGAEIQLWRRMILFGFDVGVLRVVERGTVEGTSLRGRFSGVTTLPVLRATFGGRLQLGSHLAATSLLSGEYGFEMATYREVASMARATLALGLEFRAEISR